MVKPLPVINWRSVDVPSGCGTEGTKRADGGNTSGILGILWSRLLLVNFPSFTTQGPPGEQGPRGERGDKGEKVRITSCLTSC